MHQYIICNLSREQCTEPVNKGEFSISQKHNIDQKNKKVAKTDVNCTDSIIYFKTFRLHCSAHLSRTVPYTAFDTKFILA
jgi:hypothetical protein